MKVLQGKELERRRKTERKEEEFGETLREEKGISMGSWSGATLKKEMKQLRQRGGGYDFRKGRRLVPLGAVEQWQDGTAREEKGQGEDSGHIGGEGHFSHKKKKEKRLVTILEKEVRAGKREKERPDGGGEDSRNSN